MTSGPYVAQPYDADLLAIAGLSGTGYLQRTGAATWSLGSPSSTPTAITVANEATDTTCFVGFFTAATGDLGPKTNTGLTFNSATGAFGVAGNITASGTIASGAYARLYSGGTFALVEASGASNGLWFSSAGSLGIRGNNLGLSDTGRLLFTNTTNNFYGATVDLSLGRDSSGVFSPYTTESGTTKASIACANITASGTITGAQLYFSSGGQGLTDSDLYLATNVSGTAGRIRIGASTLFYSTSTTDFNLCAASGVKVRNASNNADAPISCSNITASGSIKPGTKTIATLPSAASSTGERYQLSDSATIVNRVVFSNGSAWYYEGTAVAV